MATTPGRIRPWRYLAAFVGIVAMLSLMLYRRGEYSAPVTS